jgi:CBS domain-containing protein
LKWRHPDKSCCAILRHWPGSRADFHTSRYDRRIQRRTTMQVKDVMTREVIAIGADETVLTAARLMLQHRISGLPVLDKDGELVGIVTEGDFLRRGELGTQRRRPKWLEFIIGPGRLAEEYVHAAGRKVDEIMTTDPFTIDEDEPLEKVVEVMERRRVKRLPVTHKGRMIGIVSRANLMHALASLARGTSAPAGGDSQIRDDVLAAIAALGWAPRVNVTVKDGITELWGAITDERERQALIVAAENVPGVVRVHDQLVWVEPMSGMAFPATNSDGVAL